MRSHRKSRRSHRKSRRSHRKSRRSHRKSRRSHRKSRRSHRKSRRSHRKSRRSHRKSRRSRRKSRRSHRKSRRSHRKSRRSHRKSRRSHRKSRHSSKEIVGIYVEYSMPSKKQSGKWKKLPNAKHASGWYFDGGDAGGKVGGKTKFGDFWMGPKSSKNEMKKRLREYYNSAKKNGFVKSFVLK